jgi:Family of unknown function (DUF6384)
MSDTTAAAAAPLDEVMLAMDVVDTLRHRQDLVNRELDESAREKQLIDKLREIYRQQGIEVTDEVLKQGVDALAESRFAYTPPKPGFGVALAKLYVSRKGWGRWAFAVVLALAILLGGYFLVYRPYLNNQAEQARLELAEKMPAEMDALYKTIFEETKTQQPAADADEIVKRGKAAAAEGERERAQLAIDDLTRLRDTLRQEYTLRVVNRPGADSGFWTFPEVNTEATNYYIVVEPIDPTGKVLSLPILNEETGQTQTVAMWGVRVSEEYYNAVVEDKKDDGIIQHNIVGIKQYGYQDVEYPIPVLGGAVTQW